LTSLKDRDPVASIALIVSLGALIVSSWQYSSQIEHNRLSVRPNVVVTYILEGGKKERNGIYMANPGLGPAIIKAVSVDVGGKSYDATDKRVWRNVFRDLAIVPGCFRQGWVESGNTLKSGEEWGLLTMTHADPPVVGEHACPIELLKFLKAEGLKVRVQYESMYGEPYEVVRESWIDDDVISDVATVFIQQIVVPKLTEQLQDMVEQFKKFGEQMQQAEANEEKRTAELWGLMLLWKLYEHPLQTPYEELYGVPPD